MTKTIETLSALEAEKLLDVLLCDSGTVIKKIKGIRNYLIGLLMLDAGMRVGEVVSLQKSDLIFEVTYAGDDYTPVLEAVGTIVILPKNSKNGEGRTIPTSQRIKDAILNMNKHFWKKFEVRWNQAAFMGYSLLSPMSVRQIERIILSAGKTAIGKAVHPHMLRHTFATKLMRTTSIRIVQQLLGHKQLSSTQVYTHPGMDDLKNAINSIEP